MPRKEDRWQNIEEILSFWDNENQIEEEKLQRKGLLRKTIFAVVVALLVVVGISAWCVSRKCEVTFADEYGNRAFRECNQLMVADIPDEVTSIDNMAFWGSIRIPRNVHEIGQFCLMECNSLKDVYDEAQEPQRVVKLFGKANGKPCYFACSCYIAGSLQKCRMLERGEMYRSNTRQILACNFLYIIEESLDVFLLLFHVISYRSSGSWKSLTLLLPLIRM